MIRSFEENVWLTIKSIYERMMIEQQLVAMNLKNLSATASGQVIGEENKNAPE